MTRPVRTLALAGAAGVAGAAAWWRAHPSACPYGQRFWVQPPHPLITRARLREALGDVEGARVLEVGPGTGHYSLPVAAWVGDGGHLDLLDLQQEMLDHTLGRAAAAGARNVTGTRGDATALPYADGAFDAAFLVAVLGEIPDQAAALRELRRVLRPGGTLVVGELLGDPHFVAPGRLRARGEAAGLRFERRLGPWAGSFTRFVAPERG